VVVASSAGLALLGTAPAGAATQAPGTGKPPAGTGINTAAAFANPLCDKSQGPYGKLDFIIEGGGPDRGGGPICVAVWKGKDNGGATYQGVTKDSVKIVALVPNDQQTSARIASQRPMNYAVGTPGSGTVPDALQDALAGYQAFFETYGRTVDLEFVTSSGDDEAAQRADVVTVKAMKPFAVVDATYTGHPEFEAGIAAAKIPVFGSANALEATQKQAPYRWGQADANAGAINTAEFVGKQLTGKKAEYAGDDAVKSQTRKFGMVYSDTVIDRDLFDTTLKKYGGKITPGAALTYPASASVTGDPTVAQEQAPNIITKLKALGITSVLLMTDSAMTTAMFKQATAQDYFPEWIIAGYQNMDFPLLAQGYPQDQWVHAFGLSNLPPLGGTSSATGANITDVVKWYWGEGRGTSSAATTNLVNWFMSGIMYAGPKLTPKTFQQGFFSVPAGGGAPDDDPSSVQHGYGKTAGLPYDEYLRGSQDFTLVWWDPDAPGVAFGSLPPGKGNYWYLDGAKRYYAGHWPTKPLKFFDRSTSSNTVDFPDPQPVPCKGCPSETGQGTPSASAS
jgi:hypothetical protein